jgi:hypothetical protein
MLQGSDFHLAAPCAIFDLPTYSTGASGSIDSKLTARRKSISGSQQVDFGLAS